MHLRYFHFDLSTHIILLEQMQYVKIRVKGRFGKRLLAHQEPHVLRATRQLDLASGFSCVRWRKWLRFRAWSCGWTDAGLTEVSAPWSPAHTPPASLGMESSVLSRSPAHTRPQAAASVPAEAAVFRGLSWRLVSIHVDLHCVSSVGCPVPLPRVCEFTPSSPCD